MINRLKDYEWFNTRNDYIVFLEAQIRFLKAKLRVMQEEMDRLGQEINKKV